MIVIMNTKVGEEDKMHHVIKMIMYAETKEKALDQPYWFSHTCWQISKGDWLFDNDGEAIENSDGLKRVLTMEYHKDKKDKIWVIPVDVHT